MLCDNMGMEVMELKPDQSIDGGEEYVQLIGMFLKNGGL